MKRITLTLLVFVLFLTACQAVETTPVTSDIANEPAEATEIVQPTPASPTQAESAPSGQLDAADISAVGCTLVSPQATPGPELVDFVLSHR